MRSCPSTIDTVPFFPSVNRLPAVTRTSSNFLPREMNADYFFVATKLITGQALDTNRPNDRFLRGFLVSRADSFFREFNALLRLVCDVESRDLGVESK